MLYSYTYIYIEIYTTYMCIHINSQYIQYRIVYTYTQTLLFVATYGPTWINASLYS